jgi:transcriptional regulator with XRE-family HTH domain
MPGNKTSGAPRPSDSDDEQTGEAARDLDSVAERLSELGAFIREQRNSARLSLRRLSDLAGISNPYLSQIERGMRRPSAEILQQIAKALRISAETMYIRAGILEERDPGHDLPGEILRDPFITEDQKQTLIRIYSSFRAENDAKGIERASPQPAVAADREEGGGS